MAGHEMSGEEVREMFLNAVRGICHYWLNEPQAVSVQDKIEGAAFSILVLLDGGHGMMPGFTVCANPHPEDRAFNESNGKNWYPECLIDIAGNLHDHFHKKASLATAYCNHAGERLATTEEIATIIEGRLDVRLCDVCRRVYVKQLTEARCESCGAPNR